jgi:hypothetical protein
MLQTTSKRANHMKYSQAFDIWAVPTGLYKHIQPGQWVYAGDKSNKGIFLGIKPSGVVVCAWYQNAKSREYKSYLKTLRQYALGK